MLSVENIGMSRRDRAGLIELLAEVAGNFEGDRRKIVVKLRRGPRTEDRRGDTRLRGDPVQRDLRGRLTEFLRDAEQRVENRPVAFGKGLKHRRQEVFVGETAGAFAVLPFTRVLARKEASSKRAPRADANAEFLRDGNVLAFDVAFDERIFELQSRDALFALLLGERLGAGDVP